MAEKLHRSSEVANFGTYPADPPPTLDLHRREGNTVLEQRARQVGTAMGKAVATMRKTQDKVRNIAARSTTAAITLTETTKTTARTAASQADQLRQAAREKAAELSAQVKSGYDRARLRAHQLVRDYPLHVVLAAGVVGFLFGVGFRIWRANRER